MIIPITSAICRELFTRVPHELTDGSLALGSTRWEAIRGVLLPYAAPGIAAAVLLGLGRAFGEAIAVTQTIGNADNISRSLFAPGDTLASRIASQYQGATSVEQASSILYLARDPDGDLARDQRRRTARSCAASRRRGARHERSAGRARRPATTSRSRRTGCGGAAGPRRGSACSASSRRWFAVAILGIVLGTLVVEGLQRAEPRLLHPAAAAVR